MPTFGENLKAIRKERNLSQEEIAAQLGTSKQVISRYENGQRMPKISVATQYANILHVPLTRLIEIQDADDVLTFGEWLSNYFTIYSDDTESLSDALGCTLQHVDYMLGDAEEPTRKEIYAIAARYHKPADWLLDRFFADPQEQELVGIYRDLNDQGQSVLMGTARGLSANPEMQRSEASTTK